MRPRYGWLDALVGKQYLGVTAEAFLISSMGMVVVTDERLQRDSKIVESLFVGCKESLTYEV